MGESARDMLISYDAHETRVAILENRSLVEMYVERPKRSVVGNVYLGQVRDVLPGMHAAFVDIGLEKNAFLHVDEVIVHDGVQTNPKRRNIESMLRPNQQIIVQVTKDPMGTKGCRVTTEITFPGRFLVLTPFSDGVGVSRKLDSAERSRLQEILQPHLPEKMGVIIRTAAQSARERDLVSDLEFLLRLWKRVAHLAEEGIAPELIYSEMDLALRLVRDVFSTDFKRLVVDDKSMQVKVFSFLKRISPKLASKVQLHKDAHKSLFEAHGIEPSIQSALNRIVGLPSGGYLCFDRTEALTVIDVNTGKYVGSNNLEDTVFQTNCEAAVEVARQLRLRDIGGIIVIDFIDMVEAHNRLEVVSRFVKAMESDRAKYRVGEMSRFGLLEVTRKAFSEGLHATLVEPCQCCGGAGRVPSALTTRIGVERKIKAAVMTGKSAAYLIGVNPDTFEFLMAPGTNLVPRIRAATGRYVTMVPDEGCLPADIRILIEGSRRDT